MAPSARAACSSATLPGPAVPGGRSGNASAITARAPTAAAVRHATRAPLLRPPWTSGTPGASAVSAVTISIQAASWRTAEPGARRTLDPVRLSDAGDQPADSQRGVTGGEQVW